MRLLTSFEVFDAITASEQNANYPASNLALIDPNVPWKATATGTKYLVVDLGAATALDTAYAWLEQRLSGRTWAVGDMFSMADCAAAPALFYADWVHPISPQYPVLRDYRARLLTRPSFARAVEEGRPYRHYFPLGAPDRD